MSTLDHENKRAADSDRAAVADKLRAALDEGRLDLGEYDERLQATYTAKTYGELDVLLADLPQPGPAADPRVFSRDLNREEREERERLKRRRNRRRAVQARWGGWLSMSVLLTGIWGITVVAGGELHYFWPVWPIGIVGVCMLAGWVRRTG